MAQEAMQRRECLKRLAATLSLPFAMAANAVPSVPRLTAPKDIEQKVRQARPLLGGQIPTDLRARLGATHYDGKYYRTQRPFLLEGCESLLGLGMRVAKLWFGNQLSGYAYNSDWKLTPSARLVEVAKHPYFVEAFSLPFLTFILEIAPVAGSRKGFSDPDQTFANDEEQFYELAGHLFKTYRHRPVTFILQHWEGDWMLRGKDQQAWTQGKVPDAEERCKGFAHWLAARQRGVARARAEAEDAQCRVYHAAEVNRVWDSTRGIPTLTTHVLPHVAVDLVSWSSYDGMASPVRAWQGLELIRHYARPSPVFGKPVVYIGEVGKPEQGQSEEQIVSWWDQAMGVFFAQQVPWILHWELYCNEVADKHRPKRNVYQAEELRGFWLIRPDGSLSYSAKYLKALLDHAGGRLPKGMQRPT
jgi:hypothetical protein